MAALTSLTNNASGMAQSLLGNTAQTILSNPQVQQIIANDPQLQQDLVNDPAGTILKNKPLRDAVLQDPELRKQLNIGAGASVTAIQEGLQKLSQDPEVQKQLREAGGNAAKYAGQGLKMLGSQFKKYVEEGPAGIRLLCFFTGCATMGVGAIGLLDVFQFLFSPFGLVLNVYVVAFGAITIAVEADQERMASMPFLEHVSPSILKVQKCLNEQAKFLTTLWGRGLFYIFVGILMASDCQLCLFFLAGTANIVMGCLLILLHFGIEPDLDYLQHGANAAYNAIPLSQNLAGEFSNASAAWQNSGQRGDMMLKALYAQSTQGDAAAGARPTGVFNASAKAEYDAHAKLTNMSKEDAKAQFVQRCMQKGIKF